MVTSCDSHDISITIVTVLELHDHDTPVVEISVSALINAVFQIDVAPKVNACIPLLDFTNVGSCYWTPIVVS